MYYEEKMIDGILMCRDNPRGKWRKKRGCEAVAAFALHCLTEEERHNVFKHFCTHCGSENPRCQCWNDE